MTVTRVRKQLKQNTRCNVTNALKRKKRKKERSKKKYRKKNEKRRSNIYI